MRLPLPSLRQGTLIALPPPRLACTRPYFSLKSSIANAIRSRQFSTCPRRLQATKAPERPPFSVRSPPRWFPVSSHRIVGYWLIGSAASVFGLVVLGGLTRLTESGLSITEWRPVTGARPPMSQQDWESEFDKYRASPEFKQLNSSMTLDEFKKIYLMEWGHRLWGRVVGVTFVVPTFYFAARGKMSIPTLFKCLGISGLIGFQGFLGWWMVKSGLHDDLFAPGAHPRVSQYRLAAHLGTAFACYGWMLWAGASILRIHKFRAFKPDTVALSESLCNNSFALAAFRRRVVALTALAFATVLSGALVAGLDAGLIYNDFPLMNGDWVPPAADLWHPFYSRLEDGSDLWWRNMLENPATVQLTHRILATTTFTAVLALFVYSRRPTMARALPESLRRRVTGVVHLALTQVALGIATLMMLVPIPLAAAHQAGALALFSGLLLLVRHSSTPPTKLLSRLRKQQARKSRINPKPISLPDHPDLTTLKPTAQPTLPISYHQTHRPSNTDPGAKHHPKPLPTTSHRHTQQKK